MNRMYNVYGEASISAALMNILARIVEVIGFDIKDQGIQKAQGSAIVYFDNHNTDNCGSYDEKVHDMVRQFIDDVLHQSLGLTRVKLAIGCSLPVEMNAEKLTYSDKNSDQLKPFCEMRVFAIRIEWNGGNFDAEKETVG